MKTTRVMTPDTLVPRLCTVLDGQGGCVCSDTAASQDLLPNSRFQCLSALEKKKRKRMKKRKNINEKTEKEKKKRKK